MHIDPFILVAQIFNFLLLMYLLKRFLYWRIIKAMDDREDKIAARFAEAQEMKLKASEQVEIYEKRNQFLVEKTEQMLNEATVAAEAKRKELMEKVREEVDQVKMRWQEMLTREKEAFLQDLRQRAAKQLLATARKALSDLADEQLEDRIVDEFIRRVEKLDKEKSDQIRKAVSSGKLVIIHSAFELSTQKQKQITDALRKQISLDFATRHQLQQDIVSGIEMRINGHKIAWSLNEYLEALVESLTETLQKEAQAA